MKIEINQAMNGYILQGKGLTYICNTFEELVTREKELLGEITMQDAEWELRREKEKA